MALIKHSQSRSRGMSVRRSWFVYAPRETTGLTIHANDFANANSHACQKKKPLLIRGKRLSSENLAC